MFFGSPEKLYFLSYDIFICRRRYDFVLMYYRSSSCVITLHLSGSLCVHTFSRRASYMHWQLSWNLKFDFGFFNAFLLEKYFITRIEAVGKPYREVCLQTKLWPCKVHQPNSRSKHPGTWIEDVLAYCRVGRKYVGCIELLFKVYRANCRF